MTMSDDRVYCAACEEIERTGSSNAQHAALCEKVPIWADTNRPTPPPLVKALDRKGVLAELTGGIGSVVGAALADADHAMGDRVIKAIAEVHAPPEDASRMGAARTVGNFAPDPATALLERVQAASERRPGTSRLTAVPQEHDAPLALQVTRLIVPNFPSVAPPGDPNVDTLGWKTREGDQPLPETNTYPPIQSLVIKDMEARKTIGLRRYGTLLQPHNGRDALRDLYEELLDATNYIRQVIFERDGK